MNRLKRILGHTTLLMLLVVGFFLPASAQSQKLESLTATAKGHGRITSVTDEQEITAAVVVLRENGTVLIALCADVQLQAEATWSTSASSSEEILLKITGGVVEGEMTGSGKLLLTSDRKSFKELTMNIKLSDGQVVTVTFVAAPPNLQSRGYERGALHGTRLGLPASTQDPEFAYLRSRESVSLSEPDDEDRGILRRDISLRDDCGLIGSWRGDIGQGHMYLHRIR